MRFVSCCRKRLNQARPARNKRKVKVPKKGNRPNAVHVHLRFFKNGANCIITRPSRSMGPPPHRGLARRPASSRVGAGSCSLGLVVQVCASHRRQSAGCSLPCLGETVGCGRKHSNACKPSLLTRATSRPSARDRPNGVCRAGSQNSQRFSHAGNADSREAAAHVALGPQRSL